MFNFLKTWSLCTGPILEIKGMLSIFQKKGNKLLEKALVCILFQKTSRYISGFEHKQERNANEIQMHGTFLTKFYNLQSSLPWILLR